MNFLNPIEVLQLEDLQPEEISTALIKKKKKELLAEIELSDDNSIEVDEQQITKSILEELVNQLETRENIDFYHFISNTSDLSDFLKYGDLTFFYLYSQEYIYKQPAFVEFISPWFSERYNSILHALYKKKDILSFMTVIAIEPIVTPRYKDASYSSVISDIRKAIDDINKITQKIKSNNADTVNISKIESWVKQILNTDLVNVLPPYFQSVRNESASAIRNLSVNIFNHLNDITLSSNLLDYGLRFDVDGTVAQQLNNDRLKLKEISTERKKQQEVEANFLEWANVLKELQQLITGVDKGNRTASEVVTWVRRNVSIQKLNTLPADYQQINDNIALALRALSVSVYNSYNDLAVAMALIQLAQSVQNVSPGTKQQLQSDRLHLNGMERERSTATAIPPGKPAVPPATKPAPPPMTQQSPAEDGCLTWFMVIVAIVVVVIVVWALNRNNTSTYSDTLAVPSNELSVDTAAAVVDEATQTAGANEPPTVDSFAAAPDNADPFNAIGEVRESPWKGNQLNNGSSPLNNCFGSGQFNGMAWLSFDNSNNSDAIVCLVDVVTQRTIRNAYVRAGRSCRVNSIPTGTYYMKVYYGNDWNPDKENFCGTMGAFETNVHFSKSDSPADYLRIENSDYSYTTGTITLYTVQNGNMSSVETSEASFFNN